MPTKIDGVTLRQLGLKPRPYNAVGTRFDLLAPRLSGRLTRADKRRFGRKGGLVSESQMRRALMRGRSNRSRTSRRAVQSMMDDVLNREMAKMSIGRKPKAGAMDMGRYRVTLR